MGDIVYKMSENIEVVKETECKFVAWCQQVQNIFYWWPITNIEMNKQCRLLGCGTV
jgi:hypothetical protein